MFDAAQARRERCLNDGLRGCISAMLIDGALLDVAFKSQKAVQWAVALLKAVQLRKQLLEVD
eukprot:13841737-Alexandrium_andersonii.AAC.1